MSYKEFMELGLSTTNVNAITPKVIADAIDDVARHELVVAQVFRELKEPRKQNARRIEIPKYVNYVTISENVTPGNSIAASSFSYGAITVDISKSGIRLELDKEAIESPTRNILKDGLYLAGKEYSTEFDKIATTIALDLKTGTISSWTGGTIGTSTFTPIVSILTASSGVTITNVDYPDGQVALASSVSAGTVTFLYSNIVKGTSRFKGVRDPGTLRVYDILDLRGTLVNSTIYPDVALVNDIDLPNLVYDAAQVGAEVFVNSRTYSDKEKLLNGEIGQLLDIKLVKSGLVPEGACILVDTSRLGYDVTVRELEGEVEDRPEIDRKWYHFWGERGFKVSDTFAVGVLVNAKTGQYPAKSL